MFKEPNFTATPNELIDTYMAILPNVQFKAVMLIVRKTIGFHKRSDKISLSQFEKFTGASLNTVKLALNILKEKGLINILSKGGGKAISEYELNIEWSSRGQKLTRRGSEIDPVGGQKLTVRGSEIDPTKQRQNKDTGKTNNAAKQPSLYPKIMKRFNDYYLARNDKFKITGTEGRLVNGIIKTADSNENLIWAKMNELEHRVRTGQFIKGSGFSPATLSSNWNELEVNIKPIKESENITVLDLIDEKKLTL